jgi:ribonuclease HII
MWPFGHEEELRTFGYARVAGVDEAGRGPLAGPVVAAAVYFPDGLCPDGVADSKALTAARREAALERIVACAVWAVGIADVAEIDALNILRATHLAMRRAVEAILPCPDFLLVDGLKVNGLPAPHLPLVKGERKSAGIAAASIIAKVTRDRLMTALHDEYPHYEFARHKGYGTADHLRALAEYGPCPHHRRSFAPVRLCLEARA